MMMLIVGKTKPKILNPKQIISVELVKGKVTAFTKGRFVDGEPVVENINVREPWTVVIKTAISTDYINSSDLEGAINAAVGIVIMIDNMTDIKIFEGELRKLYGKEKSEE